ncbi:hypothetical protein P692DRAFT_20904986, partial [Suillus brevipes Sb2]
SSNGERLGDFPARLSGATPSACPAAFVGVLFSFSAARIRTGVGTSSWMMGGSAGEGLGFLHCDTGHDTHNLCPQVSLRSVLKDRQLDVSPPLSLPSFSVALRSLRLD